MLTKHLYLLRGCPASGKSTWIKEHGAERYVISSDGLRMLFPFDIDTFGNTIITQRFDEDVWKLLFQLVEHRMIMQQPIIVDATHYKLSYINVYKKLCEKYGYDILIIPFTDVPYEELVARNAKRPSLQRVPESVIKKMWDTIQMNDGECRQKFTHIKAYDALRQIAEETGEWLGPSKIMHLEFMKLCESIAKHISSNKDPKTLFERITDYIPELGMILNYDQNNKYHNMTLDLHSYEVCKYLHPTSYLYMYMVGLLHDIGKPLVASIGKDGYTHFYNHAKMGASLFRSKTAPKLLNGRVDKIIVENIYMLILHHDDEIKETFIEDKKKQGWSNELIYNLLVLQNADAKAHVQIDKVKDRVEITDKLLKKLRGN